MQLSKSCVRESAPWVQIPPSPPEINALPSWVGRYFFWCLLNRTLRVRVQASVTAITGYFCDVSLCCTLSDMSLIAQPIKISKNAVIARLDWSDPVFARGLGIARLDCSDPLFTAGWADSEGVSGIFAVGSEVEVWASVPELATSNHTD